MTVFDRLAESLQSLFTAAVIGIGGGVAWLVRRVLTDQQEIALLKQHLATADRLRDEDREAISEVRDGVKRIESWIMERGDK